MKSETMRNKGVQFLGGVPLRNFQATLLKRKFKEIESIPFYRTIIRENGIDINGDPFKALSEMPLIGATDYSRLTDDLIKHLGNDIYLIDSSSGSTGKPKQRLLTLKDEYLEIEQMLRIFRQAGFQRGYNLLLLDMWFPNMYPLFLRAANLMGINNVLAFGLNHDPEYVVAKMDRLDMDVIITIPSVIYSTIDLLLEKWKHPTQRRKPKKILFFGECLPAAFSKRIHDAIQAEIYSYYGSTELGCIGCDCRERDGFHVFEDMFFVELSDERCCGSTTVGELVLTTLQMDGTPLMRYQTRDTVSLDRSACACGNPFARIKILGRSDDMISIFGSKYYVKQFADIFFHITNKSPRFELMVANRKEADGHRYQLKLVLPADLRAYEDRILKGLLLLETIEFYVKSNYLDIFFEYVDACYFKNGTRKTAGNMRTTCPEIGQSFTIIPTG